MHEMNSRERTIRLGLIIGAAVLVAACQEPTNHQGAVGKSLTAATPAQPVASSAPTPDVAAAYTPAAAPTKPLSSCNLEYLGTTLFGSQPLTWKSGHPNLIKGWIDGSGLTEPTYWLRFDDASTGRYLQVRVSQTVQRPDVVSTHPGAPLVSGFELNIPAGSLPLGQYHVYLAAESSGQSYTCDNGQHIDAIQ